MIEIGTTQLDTTLLTIIITLIGFFLAILTYVLTRNLQPLESSGKLWDRVYELDQVVLAYPEVFTRFMAEAHRTEPYFYNNPTPVFRDKHFYQLKALIYLHLNVFEEIILTTRHSGFIARLFEQPGWHEYIIRKMRHPLLREVFYNEADIIYRGDFQKFVEKHRARIDEAPDDGIF
jgi:hypothetical protein